MSRHIVLIGLVALLVSACGPQATPTPIVVTATPVVITATFPPASPTPTDTPTPRATSTPKPAPTLSVTPYGGCMTGNDLAAWRTWDRQYWAQYKVAYEVGGSYTGGNPTEAQETIAATRAFAEWVGDHPPSVSNTHQYDVMLRFARTWRDWVSALWAANSATDYDVYKEQSANFERLYPRYSELWDIIMSEEDIMDQCPPALPG